MKKEVETPPKPNNVLAEQVVAKLVEQNLIDPQDREAILGALKDGSAKEADWVLWAEKKLDTDAAAARGGREN